MAEEQAAQQQLEPQRNDPPKSIDLRVSTVLKDLELWLNQARGLVAGPADITCMALGVVLIAVDIWRSILDPKAWSASEYLGLLSLVAFLFLLASIERALERGRRQEAELKRIRNELEALKHVIGIPEK